MTIDITKALEYANIAEHLDDEKLDEIGQSLKERIERDEQSRAGWLDNMEKWLKLVEQVMEPKNTPWPGAANIKFPLLNTAAIQFHARSFPALIRGRDMVKVRMAPYSNDALMARAQRVSQFMSYQLVDGMPGWRDEMDRLLFILPIMGMAYKKTYYSAVDGVIKSDLVDPRDVITNYHATDFNKARVTHRIWQNDNEIKEYVNANIYLDVDLGSPPSPQEFAKSRDEGQGLQDVGNSDDLTPHEIYECHDFLDLDDDGYREPYIITLDSHTGKVLRIVARWNKDSVKYIEGKIAKIKPHNFWTLYKFIPDPNSKIYALGFGTLLGPTNEAVNTLINQLVDSGTLNSLPSGFLSRGVRIRGGNFRFKPGEWKTTQSLGEDLAKGIMPLPTKEPSNVLFSLLGLLLEAGRDLSSVQDSMLGQNPGQNQPFATTQEIIRQGMQVFNGIYQRTYSSLQLELRKIYSLNYLYLDADEYEPIIGPEGDPEIDFDPGFDDIIPAANPDMVAEMDKINRANSLAAKMAAGMPLNIQEVTRRVLLAEGHDDIEALMTSEPPPPDPKVVLEQQKLEHQKMVDQANLILRDIEVREKAFLNRAKAMAELNDIDLKDAEMMLDVEQRGLDELHKRRDEVLRLIEAESAREQSVDPNLREAATEEQTPVGDVVPGGEEVLAE